MKAAARRSVRFGAGAILAAVALAALGLGILAGGEPAGTPAPATTTSSVAAGAPLALAARSGDVLVGLSARPRSPIQLRVFGGSGLPIDGTVSARAEGSSWRLLSPACGPGCFRLGTRAFEGARTAVDVRVARAGRPTREVELRLPARLPPSAGRLLARAKRTMRALDTVRIDESLSSGIASVRSSWTLVAPDRVRVESSEGDDLVVVGRHRWDRPRNGRWRESSTLRTLMPDYPWLDAVEPRLVGRGRLAGMPVQLVAAAVPAKSWWFLLSIAPNSRVLEMRMLAPAHFMVDRYRAFDEPAMVEPPT
jgi:hypothetical protein